AHTCRSACRRRRRGPMPCIAGRRRVRHSRAARPVVQGVVMKSVVRNCVLALSLATATLVSSASVRAADKPTVTLGLVAYLSEFWPALVAQKLGYFDEAGIKVDIVITGASSKTVQTASLGAIHIGSSGMIDPIRAMDGGANVKLVASGVVNSTTMLFT